MRKCLKVSLAMWILFLAATILFCQTTGRADQSLPFRISSSPLLEAEGASKRALTTSSQNMVAESSAVFIASEEVVPGKNGKLSSSVLKQMLDAVLCGTTGQKTAIAAWASLVKTGEEGDFIGIKVATEAGSQGGTHKELIQIIVHELIAAGVRPQKIIIWDRLQKNLEAAGYMNEPGFQLQWIEQGSGYDLKKTFSSSIEGQLIYGDAEFQEAPSSFQELIVQGGRQLSNRSHYATLLTHQIDKVINVPSLCESRYSGIHGALANMTLDVIDNGRRFTKAPFFGDPAIAQIYNDETIAQKVVLNLMDGLSLQYAGGPGPNPSHTLAFQTLLASLDPVALDATALGFLEEARIQERLPKIGEVAKHVASAEAAGLGKATSVKVIHCSRKKNAL